MPDIQTLQKELDEIKQELATLAPGSRAYRKLNKE
jgi:hypothetical protein